MSVRFVSADEDETITYKKDLSNQDLSNHDYSGQNLDYTNFESCDLTYTKFEGCSLKFCNFRGATLKYTNFTKADVSNSDFRESTLEHPQFFYGTQAKVNFSGLDLRSVDLNNAKLRGANLSKVKGFGDIYKADFSDADLRGANLQDAKEHSTMLAKFRKAKYDEETRWFSGFDPNERGLILVKSEEETPKKDSKKKPSKSLNLIRPKMRTMRNLPTTVLRWKRSSQVSMRTMMASCPAKKWHHAKPGMPTQTAKSHWPNISLAMENSRTNTPNTSLLPDSSEFGASELGCVTEF